MIEDYNPDQMDEQYDWQAYWDMLDNHIDELIANQPEEDDAHE